jgi:[acyl-carrier-protein] S-malonyltransferase
MVTDKVAFIFPGQGAQFVGMQKDVYEKYAQAQEVFNVAEDVLGYNIRSLCFDGPVDKLSATQVSQPAILTASVAVLSALKQEGLSIRPSYVAGLSLGEYSALVAAGSLTFKQALKLVAKRGQFMHQASQKNPGRMASVIGLEDKQVKKIAEQSGTEAVNFNCPGQVVISGAPENIKKAEDIAKKENAKKFIVIKVSGAFHSEFMNEAADRLSKELERADFSPPKTKIVFNVTADEEDDLGKIKENLSNQVNHPTYWKDVVKYIKDKQVDTFVEIGPGKVLRGLLRRTDKDLNVYSAGSIEDIVKLKEEKAQWF